MLLFALVLCLGRCCLNISGCALVLLCWVRGCVGRLCGECMQRVSYGWGLCVDCVEAVLEMCEGVV